MNAKTQIEGLLAQSPLGAAVLYFGLVFVFVLATALQVLNVEDHRAAVALASDILAQLEGRNPAPSRSAADVSVVSGSPFLDGATITVAGATLLQRIAGAVTHVGGNILSSQVDLQGAQSKQGFVSVTASCELDQPALQQLIYDLETGMPFLFIDQLVVQAPAAATAAAPSGKLRVLIAVSGQWQGAK
jgi:general secretion pathway protein M